MYILDLEKYSPCKSILYLEKYNPCKYILQLEKYSPCKCILHLEKYNPCKDILQFGKYTHTNISCNLEKLLFFKFINDKNVIWSSQHLVRQPGRLVRSLWLAAHSWKPRVAYFGCWARIGKWKWILRRQPVNSSLYNIRSFCTFYL